MAHVGRPRMAGPLHVEVGSPALPQSAAQARGTFDQRLEGRGSHKDGGSPQRRRTVAGHLHWTEGSLRLGAKAAGSPVPFRMTLP